MWRTIRVETGAPLDPIDWNGAATFSRPGFDGAFALSWQLPPPLTASSKSSPKRPYAKRFLRAFEYLRSRDGLPFAGSLDHSFRFYALRNPSACQLYGQPA